MSDESLELNIEDPEAVLVFVIVFVNKISNMKYFTISELCASATAQREGIDNRPTKCAYHLLHVLIEQLLDPIREAWGRPILVSSGYRCKELNDLVGGATHSHHLIGCAADLISGSVEDHRRLFDLIVQMQCEGRIRFTQLIWGGAKGAPLATTEGLSSQRSVACDSDGRWIHISYVPSDLRCQVIARSACG